MAYEKTIWTNREVERPRTYVMTENDDGTVTLTPSEGQVFSPGTPIDATTMNKIEDQIEANDSGLANKVSKTGDTMTGPLTATVINATDQVQQDGVSLSELFQPKGTYAPERNYCLWEADVNGVRLNMGRFGGSGKPVILYLTSAQPGASANEHRVWIQIEKF